MAVIVWRCFPLQIPDIDVILVRLFTIPSTLNCLYSAFVLPYLEMPTVFILFCPLPVRFGFGKVSIKSPIDNHSLPSQGPDWK